MNTTEEKQEIYIGLPVSELVTDHGTVMDGKHDFRDNPVQKLIVKDNDYYIITVQAGVLRKHELKEVMNFWTLGETSGLPSVSVNVSGDNDDGSTRPHFVSATRYDCFARQFDLFVEYLMAEYKEMKAKNKSGEKDNGN